MLILWEYRESNNANIWGGITLELRRFRAGRDINDLSPLQAILEPSSQKKKNSQVHSPKG